MKARPVSPLAAREASVSGAKARSLASRAASRHSSGAASAGALASRTALVTAARQFAPLGLGHGRAGNLSLRATRGAREGCLITPTGADAATVAARDLCWVPLVEGAAGAIGRFAPSSEWRFHRDIYRSRPDAMAIVHAHAPHATAIACLPEGLPPFHYGVAVAGGRDIRCAPYARFGSQALSDHALRALRDRRACLLAHHGLIAIGRSIEAALELAVEVEALARIYLLARQAGDPARLSDVEMDRVLERYRTYGAPQPRR